MNRLIFAMLAGASIVMPAHAQQTPAKFELTPFGGYRFGGSFEIDESPDSFDFEDSASYGLIVNFPHRANTRWEIIYANQSTEAEFSGVTTGDAVIDVDLQMLQIGGTYQFEAENEKVLPYLAATLGATHAKASGTSSESDTFWSGSIGLGILVAPNSRVGLRLEARAYGTFTNSSTDLLCASGPGGAGCAIQVAGDLLTQIETFAGVVFRF
jgi:hypothetical protein